MSTRRESGHAELVDTIARREAESRETAIRLSSRRQFINRPEVSPEDPMSVGDWLMVAFVLSLVLGAVLVKVWP